MSDPIDPTRRPRPVVSDLAAEREATFARSSPGRTPHARKASDPS